jgi:hypothetical protein
LHGGRSRKFLHLVYVRNANGKTEKILSKDKDNKTETIAVFYFDKTGLAIKGEGTTEGGKTVLFQIQRSTFDIRSKNC